jgi:hypothetical protein
MPYEECATLHNVLPSLHRLSRRQPPVAGPGPLRGTDNRACRSAHLGIAAGILEIR